MNTAEKLLEAIKEQAELFLIENKEFAPFATYIRENGELTYIGTYSETADSKEMYETLLNGAYEELKDEDVRLYAIGLDGKFNGMDVLVIEIILSPDDRYIAKYPYVLGENDVIFGDKI